MVAGESGLGKTTFINTLFENEFYTETDTNDKLFSEDTLSKPLHWSNKTTRISCKQAILVENGFHVTFTVLDTPGFGDYTNNSNAWAPIVSYIDGQHQLYMLQEEQPDRRKLVDTRVHGCVYFIRPNGHGLLPLDIEVMKQLSTRVNLIPVIAKSDSLSFESREQFKQKIREAIEAHEIDIFVPPTESEYDTSNVLLGEIPYSIIGATSLETLVDGSRIRARQYKWGVAEVDNEKHCDFGLLKRVLMSEHMLDLIETTAEKHYQRYRRQMMKLRIEASMEQLANNSKNNINNNVATINPKGGVEALVFIAKYGKAFLEEKQIEKDPLVQYLAKRLQEEGRNDLEFEKQSLLDWSAVLCQRRDEMIEDLEEQLKGLLTAKKQYEHAKQELEAARGGGRQRPLSMRMGAPAAK